MTLLDREVPMNTATTIQVTMLLKTLVWPILASGGIILAAWMVGRAAGRDSVPRAMGVALAVGVTTVLLGVRGIPSWPPTDTLDWLGPLVVLSAAAGIGADLFPGRGRVIVQVLLATILTVGITRLLLVPPGAEPSAAWVWAAMALGFLWAVTTTSRQGPAAGWFGAWAGAAAGAAGLLAVSGSALLGQVMGTFAAVSGVLALLGLGRTSAAANAAGPLVIAYGGLLAYAWAFTEVPRGPLVLALLAPTASWAGRFTRHPRLAILAPGVLALLMSAGSLLWARASAQAPYAPY